MKTAIRNGTVMSFAITTAAYASNGAESGGGSILMWLFFAFVGFIIVMQLVPGVTLFVGMIKGVFSALSKKEKVTAEADGRK